MVIYDLVCANGHKFEVWFKSAQTFDEQVEQDMVSCSVCGGTKVQRIPSGGHSIRKAPVTKAAKSKKEAQNSVVDPVLLIKNLHHYIKARAEDVGNKFTEEAIKIHQGEVEKRDIYGSATLDERTALDEEGVDYCILPKLPEGYDN